MQYVFTIQNECIQCIRCEINQNQTKMYSIKNAVENAGPPASVTKATRKCIINKNRIVFKMNVFNSFDVNSIKNVINKKCQTSLWKSTQINNLLSINQQTMHRTCYIGRSDKTSVTSADRTFLLI